MPTNESAELCAALDTELGLPLLALIANQVVPLLFDGAVASSVAALEEPSGTDAASQALAAGIRRAAREEVQTECLQRLAGLGAPLLQLPFLPEGAASLGAIGKLVHALQG